MCAQRHAWLACGLVLAACGHDAVRPPGSEPAPLFPQIGGSWAAGPGLPRGVDKPTVVVHRGRVHLVGGATEQYASDAGTTDAHFVTDAIAPGGWAVGPTYPVDGLEIGLFSVGDTLFGVGGLAFPGFRWGRYFRLLPDASQWDRLDFEGEPNGELSAHYVGGLAVVLEQDGTGRVWRHDRATGAWTRGATRPDPRRAFGVVVEDGVVYAVGGQSTVIVGIPPGYIDAYDVAADSWTRVTQLPESKIGVGVALLNERIHVVGGVASSRGMTMDHHVFDLRSGRWFEGPPLPARHSGLQGVAAAGRAWFLGGGKHGQQAPASEVWIFTPS